MREYEVETHDGRKYTVQLTDSDAKAMGFEVKRDAVVDETATAPVAEKATRTKK